MNNNNNNISRNTLERYKTYVELAKALKGTHQTGRAFHVTFITSKRKIISVGWNDYGRQITSTRYGNYKKFGDEGYRPCLHSELSALLKLGREDCSDLEFFNVRIDNNSEPASCKPCPNCLNLLWLVGFKNIYFLGTGGGVEKI